MTPKPQIFKDIDAIRNNDEIVFRVAIDYLFRNGYKYFTEENTKNLIQHFVDSAKEEQKTGRISVVTPEYNILIAETTHKLSKYDVWDLLRYIKRYVKIS
jgi:exo-beta-1,3-glucanase (GH17 family)